MWVNLKVSAVGHDGNSGHILPFYRNSCERISIRKLLSMSVRYQIHANDAFFTVAFQRHYGQHRLSGIFSAIRLLGVVVFVLCAITLAVQKIWLTALFTLGLAVFILFSRKFEHFWRLIKIRKSPFWNEVSVIWISDEGLKSNCNKGNADFKWQAFTRVLRFPDGFLLYQGPCVFFWLPDSALIEGFKAHDAESILREHLVDFKAIHT